MFICDKQVYALEEIEYSNNVKHTLWIIGYVDQETIIHHRERIFLRDLEFDNKIDDMKMYETPYYCLFAGVTTEQKFVDFKISKFQYSKIEISGTEQKK